MFAAALLLLGCGGDSPAGPNGSSTPKITPSVALTMGFASSCALTTSGQASCWGANTAGELGTGDSLTSESHAVSVTGASFVALSSADQSTCGLSDAGTVSCWGQIPNLGPGTPVSSPTPVAQPAGPAKFVAISTGLRYVCGLDAGGAAYCWGANSRGQLGVGDTLVRAQPTLVMGGLTFKSIGTAVIHSCGLTTAGVVYCWGSNQEGALGTGAAINAIVSSPAPVTGLPAIASLGVGGVVTCGVDGSGVAYCWGSNRSGEVGSGVATLNVLLTPTLVSGGLHFKSIQPGRINSIIQSTCAIATDGSPYCWGLDDKTQLGAAAPSSCPTLASVPPTAQLCAPAPIVVSGLGAVTALVPGIDHACAITTSKQVMCWGNNAKGQLGDGTLTARAAPAVVAGLTGLP